MCMTGTAKSNTICGYFVAKQLYSHSVSLEQLRVSAFLQAIIRLIIHPIRGKCTICIIKSLVSNTISLQTTDLILNIA